MPFTIDQLIKGSVAQTFTRILFERAGYRVARLGVEEVVREVKTLTELAYRKLGLPENLRLLPDFIVTDRSLTRAFLTEVKFRTDFERRMPELRDRIETQRKAWPNLYVIILIANSPNQREDFLQDHMRVITPETSLDLVFNQTPRHPPPLTLSNSRPTDFPQINLSRSRHHYGGRLDFPTLTRLRMHKQGDQRNANRVEVT